MRKFIFYISKSLTDESRIKLLISRPFITYETMWTGWLLSINSDKFERKRKFYMGL